MDLIKNNAANEAGIAVNRGTYAFSVFGTSIGGKTISLERKMTAGWQAVADASTLTKFAQVAVDLPAGIYRASVSAGGAAASGDLEATLARIS